MKDPLLLLLLHVAGLFVFGFVRGVRQAIREQCRRDAREAKTATWMVPPHELGNPDFPPRPFYCAELTCQTSLRGECACPQGQYNRRRPMRDWQGRPRP